MKSGNYPDKGGDGPKKVVYRSTRLWGALKLFKFSYPNWAENEKILVQSVTTIESSRKSLDLSIFGWALFDGSPDESCGWLMM